MQIRRAQQEDRFQVKSLIANYAALVDGDRDKVLACPPPEEDAIGRLIEQSFLATTAIDEGIVPITHTKIKSCFDATSSVLSRISTSP